jgi:AraC-like DNA-binding protein
MTEAISPLYNFGTLTGFLMMGQVYDSEEERYKRCEELLRSAAVPKRIEEVIGAIPTVDKAMIASYVKIMTICAQYLTLSHAIPSNKPTIAQLAKEYISVNYSQKISIKKICADVGCSKSSLITAFKREVGITVNSYITEVRLSEALHLIEMGESKIGEIAEACGFSDQSYFSKVFSAKYGVPPSEYDKISERKKPIWR